MKAELKQQDYLPSGGANRPSTAASSSTSSGGSIFTAQAYGLHPREFNRAKVPEGALVLDPYMGSGTTGIACIRTGRRFVGIEIDAGHFATARQRLENELRQGLLPLTHNKGVTVDAGQ